jgi:phosphate transport system permease protein
VPENPAPAATDGSSPRGIALNPTRPDQIYRAFCLTCGLATLVVLVLIGAFLLIRAWPALKVAGWRFLTTEQLPPVINDHTTFGIRALIFGTIEISTIALIVAVPVSIATALFISDYAPRQLRRPMTSVVEVLAAVPSLVYGLWGFFFLQPRVVPISQWLNQHLGWIPVFKVSETLFASSPFIAGLVVSLMVIPISTSVMREVFSQAPPAEKEGALALGATRWAMVRAVVLPFGAGGIIGGSMLGLGRALGETIAVAIILSTMQTFNPHILQSGGATIPATIALRFGESNGLALSALMAAGAALFGMTLLVNTAASMVVARSRSGQGVEI